MALMPTRVQTDDGATPSVGVGDVPKLYWQVTTDRW
jgi:hypothetical protein